MSYNGGSGGSGASAPKTASYLVLALNGTLTAERIAVAGAGLTSTDSGAGGNFTVNVGAGTGISVGADTVGLDTASTRNTDHAAVSVTAGAGLTGGGDISATRTLDVGAGTGITVNANDVAITATGVSAASYGDATHVAAVTFNAQGQATAASSVAITFPTVIGGAYTVATLPVAPPQGTRAWVTDATAPMFLAVAVGSGAVVAPVFFDGTNWVTA